MYSFYYFHTCNDTEKCKCGWVGCSCQTKLITEEITPTLKHTHVMCPKCNEVISTGTLTTN
jgi:hypothetical protein